MIADGYVLSNELNKKNTSYRLYYLIVIYPTNKSFSEF